MYLLYNMQNTHANNVFFRVCSLCLSFCLFIVNLLFSIAIHCYEEIVMKVPLIYITRVACCNPELMAHYLP